MPPPLRAWYSLPDIEALATRRAILSGEIKLDELTRFSDLVESCGGVAVRLSFESRDSGWQALQLSMEASLRLICQRCLDTMEWVVEAQREFGFLAAESLLTALPPEIEPVVLDGERFRPLDIVEDELILSLPLVARHDNEACRAAG